MKKRRKVSKYVLEYAIYGMIWILLFMAQILEGINKPHYDSSSDSILKSFIFILPFFIFFLIHDFSLSYFELKQKKRWVYLAITISATIFMMFHHELVSPDFKKHDKFGRMHDEKFDNQDFDKFEEHEFENRHDDFKHKPDFDKPPKGPKPFHFFPPIANTLLVLLIIVFNRGLKMQFRYFAKEKRFMELENENIQNELNYLKHQINPHFFMNTLNSIHALVRTNPEKAEDAIVGFSKIMRYLLYESNQPTVSLEKELVLIKNYVALMRLLLTDHVKINLELPWIYPTTHIPPLIFITFLENAFKHGISYSKESYINFTLKYDEQYIYSSIHNSNHHVKSEVDSGIGLENVKKRLFLIYGDRYNLKITNAPSDFRVDLQIPIQL
ncbi:MAG: hypothetical protein CVU02_00590 [Bacteroidetes bacterium HGW-Bacteroidetes-19]|nr:MAG: hypothetical protein CVU02_00590 [Bacteroidetes bacterium HGW-Bacteroidetes-19]